MRGTECRVLGNYGKITEGYVVEATKKRGITIHNSETDTPCYCLNRKEFFDIGEWYKIQNTEEMYDYLYDKAIKEIKEGKTVEVFCIDREYDKNYVPKFTIVNPRAYPNDNISGLTCPYR